MRFLARAFKYSRHEERTVAAYVPKNVIAFYGLNPYHFNRASSPDTSIYYRASPNSEWQTAPGYLGLYSSRRTIRVIITPWEDDIAGKLLEFKVELEKE